MPRELLRYTQALQPAQLRVHVSENVIRGLRRMALHDEPMQSCLLLVDTNLRIANELVWLSVVGRFQVGLLPISTQFPASGSVNPGFA